MIRRALASLALVPLLAGCGAAQGSVGTSSPVPPTVTPIPPTATPMPTRVPVLTADDGFQYHIIAASLYPSLGVGTNQEDAGHDNAWLVSIVDIKNATGDTKYRVGGNADDYVLVDGTNKVQDDFGAEDVAKDQFGVEKLGGFLGTGFDAGQSKDVVFVYKVPTGNHRYEESFQKGTQLVNLAVYLSDKQMTAATFRQAAADATSTAGAMAAATAAPIATAQAAQAATAQSLAIARADATSAANAPQAVAHLGAGNTLLQAGNLQGAANEYATAQALSPNLPDVQSAVGTVQARIAQATAQARAKAVTDHLGAAHSFEQAANYDAALKEYDAALAIDPQNAQATRGRAKVAATATAIAQVQMATATAQAEAASATARAVAGAQATAQAQERIVTPPSGKFEGTNGSTAVIVSNISYLSRAGIFTAAPGSRFIALGVTVGGRGTVHVNPNNFTLVLEDGSSYSYDQATFSYWSNPLNDVTVPAGGNAFGGLVFHVEAGVAPKQVIYRPLEFLSGTITVDLSQPYNP